MTPWLSRAGGLLLATAVVMAASTKAQEQGGDLRALLPPGSVVSGFTPDLRTSENRVTAALLVKF